MCFRYKKLPHFLVLQAVLQLLLSASSCSVMEDRDLCPCTLELDYSGCGQDRLKGGVVTRINSTKGGEFHIADTVRVPLWSVPVPRTKLSVVTVWPPEASSSDKDAVLRIPEGHDCPEVWMYSETMSTDCENRSVEVSLHKNYSELTISVRNSSGDDFPYRMELRGNICGYDLYGNPLPGLFIAPVESSSRSLSGSAKVPRQVDNSLILDIISEDDTHRAFAIGNYIDASGYDWTSPDLKDIEMEIDYSRSLLSFKIGPWQKSVEFEVVI